MVLLRFRDGLSYTEIGRRFEVTETRAQALVAMGVLKLCHQYGPEGFILDALAQDDRARRAMASKATSQPVAADYACPGCGCTADDACTYLEGHTGLPKTCGWVEGLDGVVVCSACAFRLTRVGWPLADHRQPAGEAAS